MWKRLFSFKGRINRTVYWIYTALFLTIIIIDKLLFENSPPLAALVALLALWPWLAIQAKRWHDRDKSAWWILINIVPFGVLWAFIENGFLPGTVGPNRFDGKPIDGKLPPPFFKSH
jgi:uncharacterized membrane protein YhaH (DUF805 family)